MCPRCIVPGVTDATAIGQSGTCSGTSTTPGAACVVDGFVKVVGVTQGDPNYTLSTSCVPSGRPVGILNIPLRLTTGTAQSLPGPNPCAARRTDDPGLLRRRRLRRGMHELPGDHADRPVHRPEGRHRAGLLQHRLDEVVLPHPERWNDSAARHAGHRLGRVRLDLLHRVDQLGFDRRRRRAAWTRFLAPAGRHHRAAAYAVMTLPGDSRRLSATKGENRGEWGVERLDSRARWSEVLVQVRWNGLPVPSGTELSPSHEVPSPRT